MERYGTVIRLKPGALDEYVRLHEAVWPEVLATISACNIRNYSIYYQNGLLFAYLEYHGDDYEADMAKMAADPATRRWWRLTDPLQEPMEGAAPGEWWSRMTEVFHTE